MAERQGFEPWEGGCPSTVFKTAAFDRSATSPKDCPKDQEYTTHEIQRNFFSRNETQCDHDLLETQLFLWYNNPLV